MRRIVSGWAAVVAAAALLGACGGGSGVGAGSGGEGIDAGPLDADDEGSITPPWRADALDAPGDATDGGPVEPGGPGDAEGGSPTWPPCVTGGEPGCPCDGHEHCFSGWCISTGDGDVCTSFCDDPCPAGWECAEVTGQGDVAFVCVPLWTQLCRPCETGADCAQLGDTGGWCLPAADGSGAFCGGTCGEAGACPDGFACETVAVGEDTEVEQCLPVDGAACECNDKAAREGASTPCAVSNEVGTCVGARWCTADGLTMCDAAEPLAEVCNGLDDDCDGVPDDLAPEPCTHTTDDGVCVGETVCAGGQWLACSAAVPAPEICNGLDDDCDSETDEGEPDLDADGVADCVDDDDDGDGVLDDDDVCPAVADPEQADLDGDGEGDLCDGDLDGDGSPNGLDCEPADASVHPGAEELCDGLDQDCDEVADDGHPDSDSDGVMDCVDADDDGDDVPDVDDNCHLVANPGQDNCDGDPLGDACDPDDDGDGALDGDDCAVCDAQVYPGAADLCNASDDDCDGEIDEDCSYQLLGYTWGGGPAAAASFGFQVRGGLATTPFVGDTSDATYVIRPGLVAPGAP